MIQLRDIAIQQGEFAITGIDLHVERGRYAVLMGRTGSGKTTLLEIIAGLRRPASGSVELAGRDVTRLPPAARNIGYVPQDGALFPHMTVRRHLSFALDIRRAPAALIEGRVTEMADLLGITHLLDRTPGGLSGGERQRVALGRALAFQPPVLLLDEPLSALDEATRDGMYTLIRRVRDRPGVTALHVTHSSEEARELGDVVLAMQDGKIEPQMNADERG